MKHFGYSIIGGLIGVIAGIIFGFAFDSFYTKKSQFETKQTFQAVLFGTIGLICGAGIGIRIAEEENKLTRKNQQAEEKYQKSLVKAYCNYCSNEFQFSTLNYTSRSYCDNCTWQIKSEYVNRCLEINKIVDGIDKLKMPYAITARLDKAEEIARSLIKYEHVTLDFIIKKPSQILKAISEYRKEKGV